MSLKVRPWLSKSFVMVNYQLLERGHGCVSKNKTGSCPEVCIIMSRLCVTIDGVWIGDWIY
jgi:hypothetical protein